MKLLEGLQGIGIDSKDIEQPLFQDKKVNEDAKAKVQEKKLSEEDYLFFKNVECPCCFQSFKTKRIKAKSMKVKEQLPDLRMVYEDIEPLKYQNIICPYCGILRMRRFFGH